MIGLKIASHSPAVSSFQSENPKDVRARNSSVGYRYGLFAVWYSLFAKPLAPSASASPAGRRVSVRPGAAAAPGGDRGHAPGKRVVVVPRVEELGEGGGFLRAREPVGAPPP